MVSNDTYQDQRRPSDDDIDIIRETPIQTKSKVNGVEFNGGV